MVARTNVTKTTLVLLAAGLTACGSSSDSSGPNTNTGPQAFAPTRDTALTGTVQFTTFNVPAGVTVTATGALTINASGSVQIAGTLKAPCFPLSVLGAKSVTITGTVSTACAVLAAAPPTLLILADSGYTLQGANIVASGPLNITTDTTLTDAGFPASSQVDLSRSSNASRSSSAAQLAGGFCTVSVATFTANPPSAANGAAGSPVGQNGQDGDPWSLSCTGELDIEGTVTVTSQSGGNGGAGTSTSAATAVGGNGGKGGTLKVRSAGPMVISGQNSFASGNGGDGGPGSSTTSTQGTPASAIGGKGGDVTGGSGPNGPVDIRAKGSITISGSAAIVVGHGGAGGVASATGATGQAGQPGAAATATGGNGGNTSPYGLAGSNVTGLASVQVQGGNGGAGGKATASAGNGGAPGGAGGPNAAIGGNGGNAQVKNQSGALVGNGGAAGSIEIDNANGAAGSNGCPAAGQQGGGGGNATGHPGVVGTGANPGAPGSTLLNNTGNGANGGNGNAPGTGGLAGTDGTAAPKTANGVNFTPGQPGNPCPTSSSTVQIVNADTSDPPWDSVQVSVNGGVFTNATKSGTTYTIDLTGVASTATVQTVVAFSSGTAKHLAVFEGPASWLLAMAANQLCGSSNCPLPFTTKFWGVPSGRVTFTETGLTSQATVRVGDNVATANATLPSGNVNTLLGVPTGISQAIGQPGGLITGVSGAVATLTNNQDISQLLLPTVQPQNVGVSIPAGSIGGLTLTSHGVDALDWRIGPRLTLLDHFKLFDVAYFSKQFSTASSFGFPTIPSASMPSNGLQWLETTMIMTPTTYLGEVAHARSFGPSHSVTFASTYNAPTITTQTGPSGMSFVVSGQFAPLYVSGEFHSSVSVPSGVILIDGFKYQPAGGQFTFVLPPIPIGGSGPYFYEAATNDLFSIPTDGGIAWRAGFKGYLGTPPTQAITVTGPSAPVTVQHGGGCATSSINVTTTGVTQLTFVNYIQTAGAAGTITVTPQNSVIQPGSGGTTPISHGIPITICSSLSSTGGGTAVVQVNAASNGLASFLSNSANISVTIN